VFIETADTIRTGKHQHLRKALLLTGIEKFIEIADRQLFVYEDSDLQCAGTVLENRW
jgi:hypothetical protein